MKRVVSGLSFTHNSGRFTEQTGLPEAVFVQLDFSRHRFPKEIIIQCVHWYLRFNVSTRDLEEMMRDRGIAVDHSSIDAWVNKFSPQIDTIVKKKRKPTGKKWRLDETYVKVKGKWKYLYRAVDEDGQTLDFLLTARRDAKAAKRFLKKVLNNSGIPEKIYVDKSGANKKAIEDLNEKLGLCIKINQSKYKNNLVEQDHRGIKRPIKHRQHFRAFHSAHKKIRGVESVRMIYKGQVEGTSSVGEFFKDLIAIVDPVFRTI